jgi:hypothetical protein
VGGEAPQHTAEQEPVDVASIKIGHDQVGTDRADHLQRSHTILDRDDVETATLQSLLHKAAPVAVSPGDEGAQVPPK